MSAPLVSIIVPVYNSAPFLDESLGSLFAQDYENIEFILVDDCSTDNSYAKLQELKAKNPELNITIHQNDQNLHLSRTRNVGLGLAQGEYVFFSDADDLVAKELISSCVAIAERDNADFVHFGVIVYGQDTWIDKRLLQATSIEELKDRAFLFHVSAWSKLVRTSFLRKNSLGFQDIRIAEDIIWTIQLIMNASRISFCNKLLYDYKLRNNSLFNKFTAEHLHRVFALYLALKEVVLPFKEQYKGLWNGFENKILSDLCYEVDLYNKTSSDSNVACKVNTDNFTAFIHKLKNLLEQDLVCSFAWYEKIRAYRCIVFKHSALREHLKLRHDSYLKQQRLWQLIKDWEKEHPSKS